MSTQTISRVMSSLPVSTQTDVNRTSHVQVPEVSEEEVVVLDGGSPSKQRRMSAERYPLPICKECDKMFKNSSQLGQHMLVHNNIRKQKCTFCEKTFKQLSHLQQHVRMHADFQKRITKMWHYFWAHFTYHLVRWFPRDNRKKISVVLAVFSVGLLVPQFIVLFQKHTTRWCPSHLFELLIVSIIFTFITLGFCFLFMMMNPVPRPVKVVFHAFGLICFVETLVHIASTANADDCKSNTVALYYICLALSWIGAVSLIFFFLMFPFWVVNAVKRDCVLDMRTRQGVCYEPVKCCSCMWHI